MDPSQIGRNYPAEVAIQGDAKATLERLIEAVEPVPERPAWTARVRELVEGWRAEFDGLLRSGAVPIRPERLCQEITDFLPSDAILVSDTGHAGIWTGTMIEITEAWADLSQVCRFAGLGLPRGHGREVRGARQASHLLHG